MPIVVPHDPVGAFMQLQEAEQLQRQQQREEQEGERANEARQRAGEADYRTQMQGWEAQQGLTGRGQGATQQTPALQAAQIRQLDAAHDQGIINDDDYELAKQAVQFGGHGFNPFAEKFQQGGAQSRFEQAQSERQQQQQSTAEWEQYRATVQQANMGVQQAQRMLEAARPKGAFSPEYAAAAQQLQEAYQKLQGTAQQMPSGAASNPDTGQPSPSSGQVPQAGTRITPGAMWPGNGAPAINRGGGAPFVQNPTQGTGQVTSQGTAPGMAGQGRTAGALTPMPRSKVRSYMEAANYDKDSAKNAAIKDGYDPENVYDDQPGPQTGVPRRAKARSAAPINQGQADNEANQYDPSALMG